MTKPEQMLLDLSLEVSAAKERAAALAAFKRYLSARFQSAKPSHYDLDPANEKTDRFAGGRVFHISGKDYSFHLSLANPVVYEMPDAKGEAPSETELATIAKIVKCFNERMEEVATLKGLTFTDDLTGLYNQRYLEVILDRESNRHMAFGSGIHRCAGSNLARMELRVAALNRWPVSSRSTRSISTSGVDARANSLA